MRVSLSGVVIRCKLRVSVMMELSASMSRNDKRSSGGERRGGGCTCVCAHESVAEVSSLSENAGRAEADGMLVSVCGPIQWRQCARVRACPFRREREKEREEGEAPPAFLPCTCARSAGCWLPVSPSHDPSHTHKHARAQTRTLLCCDSSVMNAACQRTSTCNVSKIKSY